MKNIYNKKREMAIEVSKSKLNLSKNDIEDRDVDNSDLIKNWDFEKDYIHENEDKLLNKSQKDLWEYGSLAYVLNTSKGVYYEKHNNVNNFDLSNSLYLDDGTVDRLVFYDMVITGTTATNSFMIIYDRKSGNEYLIDTTGFIYKLSELDTGLLPQICSYKIRKNFKTCCFDIIGDNNYEILYVDKNTAEEHYRKNIPDDNLVINKKFLKFLNQRNKEDDLYLYFTLTNSKNGAICRYFCEKYGNYEILPNVFLDDNTINIRVKMPSEKEANEDHYFMCSKYELSFKKYSIYNMPLESYIGALDLYKYKIFGFLKPSFEKAPMYISINETIKKMMNYESDYELFKKFFCKLDKKINLSFSMIKYKNNTFEKIKPEYPTGYEKDFIEKKKKYYEMNNKYKEKLNSYESSILEIIINNDYYIPKWKSESDLYILIKKYYDDAIFQYRAPWLGQQSIDVYIPSLKIGFEYQGEQHFKPIDFFGGKASFEENIKRDNRKKSLCDTNNICLIYWNYNELVNDSNLKKKLKDYDIDINK